jgi:3-oxoacyl-[acyl-carrier-protein] synthase III
MALFSIPEVRLSAVSVALPAYEVRNRDLDLLDESQSKAFARTVGIETRRQAPPAICASDLCTAAARCLLERIGIRPAEIGILVFVTQTPDFPVPGNSMLAQRQLGLPSSTYLLDFNQGCAGYVYGLASLAGLMHATGIEKGLLLAGDTLTRIVSSRDGSTLPLFSDAGSATVLERDPQSPPMHFNLGSEGRGAEIIQVKGGGARQPFGPDSLVMTEQAENVVRAPIHLSIRGLDVLQYCARYVTPNITELLKFAGVDLGSPDYYVFHQANRLLNECLMRQLGLPPHKVPETLSEYGNTSCATIPVTLCSRLGEQLSCRPTSVVLSGFGAGFSWGSSLIAANSVFCPAPLEIGEADGR